MTNLVTNIAETVESQPDAAAIGYEGRVSTYRELWDQTGAFASGLVERGFEPGDRVGIYLPNLPSYVVAFHGTLRAGGVVVPMNPQYKAREIEYLLADSGATVVVTLDDLAPHVEDVRDATAVEHIVTVPGGGDVGTPLAEFFGDPAFETVDRADDDLACQPYTSGTTGRPKGVMLTHENLGSNAEMAGSIIPEGVGPNDKQLGVLPLFHIYGMTVTMNATLFGGGSYYPMPQWNAQDAAALVAQEQLTLMHGVPAMYNDIINQPNAEALNLSSLRLCGVGGAGIPVEVLRRFEELYPVKIYEGYGLTETSPVTHFNSPEDGRRVGSVGRTLSGVDCRVVDEDFEEVPPVGKGPIDEEDVDLNEITGELVVSGPNVMKGYYNLPEANEEAFTEADGKRWFHTGDLGYHDEDGFYYIVDRAKHMILTAGYNVYPREVEELLFEHPAVADVAVVGIPDERRGETVKAFVVRKADTDVTADEIKQFCLDNLAAYKHPREVEFVDALPRTTTGKVQKFELQNRGDAE